MWPDNETTNDLIGFKVHADLIRAVVTNPSMLPTTIGVFGDWGGGKTSIMKMLERDLDPSNWPEGSDNQKRYESLAVVYVNTWLFEGYDDAKAALLSTILAELADHKRFGGKLRDAASSLMKSVDWMRLSKMTAQHIALPGAIALFTGGLGAIPAALATSLGLSQAVPSDGGVHRAEGGKPELKDLLKESTAHKPETDIRTFRKRFRKMLDDGGITTLVIVVDDLDRCTPERIIENLEAVKLFLSVDRTAFVIGADRRIVEHAIRTRYVSEASVDTLEGQRLVKDYLEKLVQVPYNLPRLSASEIETYMTLLFCQQHLTSDQFAQCLAGCDEHRASNRYASFGYSNVRAALRTTELPSELTASLAFVASSARLIADGLKGNPRQVKRFLNAFLLRRELARIAGLNNVRDDVLVKLMILEYTSADLFAQLFSWQAEQDGHPEQIAILEGEATTAGSDSGYEDMAKKVGPKWSTSVIRRWVLLEPYLKDVDLRDYFWVARDRLESTFSGLSMVAPIVRTILEGLISELPPKRNSAMESAKTLSEDDRASLFDLISQRIVREPETKLGYDAIRYLAEAGLPGSAELFNRILMEHPLEKVPAAVGMDIMNLCNSKSELTSILQPAKELLLNSSSKAGKAAQSALMR